MYKKIKKHIAYYISLILILSFGLFLIGLASPDIKAQAFIILLTVFFYILWGIFHHLINHELTAKIVVEYVLIGLLGIAVLFFVLVGGIL